MMNHFLMIALVLAIPGAGVQAQPLRTDILAGTYSQNLVRTTIGGVVSTVGSFGTHPALAMDIDNKHVLAADGFFVIPPFRVLRIDPVSRSIVATLWSGAPFNIQILSILLDQDGDYILCEGYNPGKLYRLKADGSALTTIYIAPAGHLLSGAIEDQISGDWILSASDSMPSGGQVFLCVSRDGSTVNTITKIPYVAVGSPMQDPHRTEIYYASGSSTFLTLEPSIGIVKSLGPSTAPLVCLTMDRSPAPSGGLIYACDRMGVLSYFDRNARRIGTISTIAAMSLVIEHSRNIASRLVKAPNNRVIHVSFPASAGRPFVLALSASGYTPGLQLGDGRVIPLVLDSLTLLTSRTSIPPLLAGNVGVLDSSGGAKVTMNLNGFGSALKGVRIWAAAVTFEKNAPLGIAEISRSFLLVL